MSQLEAHQEVATVAVGIRKRKRRMRRKRGRRTKRGRRRISVVGSKIYRFVYALVSSFTVGGMRELGRPPFSVTPVFIQIPDEDNRKDKQSTHPPDSQLPATHPRGCQYQLSRRRTHCSSGASD